MESLIGVLSKRCFLGESTIKSWFCIDRPLSDPCTAKMDTVNKLFLETFTQFPKLHNSIFSGVYNSPSKFKSPARPWTSNPLSLMEWRSTKLQQFDSYEHPLIHFKVKLNFICCYF